MRYVILLGLSFFLTNIQVYGQCQVGESEMIIEIDGSAGQFNSEIYWRLFNDDTNALVAETTAGFLGSGATERDTLCLQDGAIYRFETYDTFGDGWNEAEFNIFYNDGFIVLNGMPNNVQESVDGSDLEEIYFFKVGDRPGDDCSMPAQLNLGTNVLVNTLLYSNSHVSDQFLDSGKEAVFEFTPSVTDDYNISFSLLSSPNNASIQLFDNCYEGNPSVPLDTASAGSTLSFIQFSHRLTQGQTYFIVVSNDSLTSGVDEVQGNLNIAFSGDPINITCTDAFSLTVDGPSVGGRMYSSPESPNPLFVLTDLDSNVYDFFQEPLTYNFNLANQQDIAIEIDGLEGFTNSYVELLKLENCGEEPENSYKRVSSEGVQRVFAFENLVAGTYRINIYIPFGVGSNDFQVSAKTFANIPAAANQDCSSALNANIIEANQSYNPSDIQWVSLFNGNDSGLGAPCGQDSIFNAGTADVWIKAQVPASRNLAIQTFGELYDVATVGDDAIETRFAFYSGTCGSLTEIFCSDKFTNHQSDTLNNLIAGEEVFVRLWDRNGNDSGQIGVVLSDPGALPTPELIVSQFPDSLFIDFQLVQEGINFNYNLNISADSFNTYLPGFNPAVVSSMSGGIPVSGLQPATKYYLEAWSSNGFLTNSDTIVLEVKTAALTINSIADGNWSDPNIWEGLAVPPADSAVDIRHKVTINQNENFNINQVTIRGDAETTANAGLWINNGSLIVENDVLVTTSSAVPTDSVGIFITTSGTSSSTFNVGSSLIFDINDEAAGDQLQFSAINTGDSLNINVGNEFAFRHNGTDSTKNYTAPNINFQSVDLTVGGRIFFQNNSFNNDQPFNALFESSRVEANEFTLNSFENTNGEFQVNFTGSTEINLSSHFRREGSGGKINFTDQSILRFTGVSLQQITGFEESQDSIVYNNVEVNIENDVFSSQQIPTLNIIPSISGNPLTKVLIHGELNLIKGIVKDDYGIFDFNSSEVIFGQNATVIGANSNSYIYEKVSKIGNTPFTFPVGSDLGLKQIGILDNNEFQLTDKVSVLNVDNSCGLFDSLIINSSLARDRTEEFWQVTAELATVSVLANFEPVMQDPLSEGVTDLSALELINFNNGNSLGNGASTDSSFITSIEYDFSVADTARLGLASNLVNENPLNEGKKILMLSTYAAAPGESVTVTYSASFASPSDAVFVGGKQANVISNTANSLVFTVPEGARSGKVELIYDTDKIASSRQDLIIKYSNTNSIFSENYSSLSAIDVINGNVLLGQTDMQVELLDNDNSFDAMILSRDYPSITVVKNLSGTTSTEEFNVFNEGASINPTKFQLGLSNFNQTVGVDAIIEFESNGDNGLLYYQNDGFGNFNQYGEGEANNETIYNDYIFNDISLDGITDPLFSFFSPSANTGVISIGNDGESCDPQNNSILPFFEPSNKNISSILPGDFIDNGSLDIGFLVKEESTIGMLDLYSQDTSFFYSDNSRSADQIYEIKIISLLNNGVSQIVASNQFSNEIEIYSFNNASSSIDITNVPLSFTPAKMDAEDINGDGFQDLIVSDQNAASLHILINDGSGILTEEITLAYSGGVIADFDVMDLNNDGFKDFIILQEGGQLSAVYYELVQPSTAPIISASNISTSGFDLAWDSVAFSNEYEIFISLENDTIADLSTDTTFILGDTALSFNAPIPFETYYVFGRSISLSGDTSNFSNPVVVNLLALDSLNFQTQNISTSTFDLSWSAIENAAEYELFISLENDTIADLSTDSTFIIADTVFSFNAPVPFETYYVFGRSISSSGDTSNFSNSLAVNLLTLDSLNFQAQNITNNGFDLSWGSISSADLYEIIISLQDSPNAGLPTDSVFQLSDTLLSFNAPIDFEQYYVFGRAISAQGDTANFGNSYLVQLESIQTPLPASSNLSSNGFDLSWPSVAGADQYQIYIGTNADVNTLGEADSVFVVNNQNISYRAPEYSELYYFFVKAISDFGDTSAYSVQDSVKLPVSLYLQQDSLALVSLYETNGGATWINKQNWLTGKLNTWEGLEMNADTLYAINLASNQLEGILSSEMSSLNFINSLDFSDNNLTDVSALVPQTNKLSSLNLSGNALSFEQLEGLSSIPNFIYNNQDYQYDLPVEIFESLGTDISITVEANAMNNNFQWYKGAEQIAGETNPTLNLVNAQRAAEGLYYVEINNTILSDLTLTSNITEVKISSLERDVIALRQFYDSTNGDGWSSIIWDTTSDNPTEWSSNAQDIIVEDNRVVEINLPDNNLTGSVPSVLNEVRGLRIINLANNALESVTDLTALPNLTRLDLSGNALGFDDLERNISVEGFEFSNQANFGNEPDQKIAQGSSFSLNFEVEGSANIYTWYKNDVLISNANTSEISIDSITYETMGEYRLEVGNEIVNTVNPDFKLSSNSVNIIATSTISGNVQDANEFAVETGRLYLFKEAQDGTLDSLKLEDGSFFQTIQNDGSFEIQNVELGDYILFVNNDENSYPNLLNTYYRNTIDWELAETVNLRSNINDLTVTMEGQPEELTGTSVLSGFLEEEFEEGQRVLPRRRVSGAGASVRKLVGSTRSISFRSILENSELVAYVETNENGEFVIPNLPAGNYTIKFDIPGVPMNEESDINFEFTGEDQEALEIAAVSDNGQITVSRISYTANKSELLKNVVVYPNPSDGRFKIGGTNAISNIKIISSDGRLIKELSGFNNTSQEIEVDLGDYPNGMYFMQIHWKDGVRSMNKLIKK